MSSYAVVEASYEELLRRSQPRVIRDEAQNERYTEWLEELSALENLTPDQRELADLLTVLIEEFEEKNYALNKADPIQVIRELMSANGMKQKDLVDVFGTPSLVSEVLNGKRKLTISHIRKLGRKFNVAPEVFLPQR